MVSLKSLSEIFQTGTIIKDSPILGPLQMEQRLPLPSVSGLIKSNRKMSDTQVKSNRYLRAIKKIYSYSYVHTYKDL